MRNKGFHHVAFACRDIEATVKFYEDLMGFPLIHTELGGTSEAFMRHIFSTWVTEAAWHFSICTGSESRRNFGRIFQPVWDCLSGSITWLLQPIRQDMMRLSKRWPRRMSSRLWKSITVGVSRFIMLTRTASWLSFAWTRLDSCQIRQKPKRC